MPESQPDLEDILTSERIGAAITALTDPNHNPTDGVFHLDETERDSIRQVVGRSDHPLAGLAASLLDQWDDLEADDRVAGLLLFAELAREPRREQSLSTGRRRGRGVER